MLLWSTAENPWVSADVAGIALSLLIQTVSQWKLQIVCDKMIVDHRFSSGQIRHLFLAVMSFIFCLDQVEEKLPNNSALERERPVYCKVAGCRRMVFKW